MNANQKILKLLPFMLLIIYSITIFLFPNITYENRIIILISMIILAAVSFGVIIKNESLSKVKKQKIVQLSFGVFTTFILMTYYLNVA
jgi:hypothetical protein